MKKLILLICVISLIACTTKRIPYSQGRKIWKCSQELGRFDTCCIIKENFFKGSANIVYMDSACVMIWGRKCEINKGELLYAKSEWWPSVGHWKYFLVNEDETIKYTLK